MTEICSKCGSNHVIKGGLSNNKRKQRYICVDCGRKFVRNPCPRVDQLHTPEAAKKSGLARRGLHNSPKTEFKKINRSNEMIQCACGCGELMPKYDKKWRRRYYIANHCRSGRFEEGLIPWSKAKRNAQERRKRKMNPMFRLNANVVTAIWEALNGNKNGRHWEDLVGYSLEQLKNHLQKQFIDGMTWENYGKNGWHLEHKIPKAAFNFTKPEHRDFRRCWALKNLQPMWAKDNLKKWAKLDEHFQPSLPI